MAKKKIRRTASKAKRALNDPSSKLIYVPGYGKCVAADELVSAMLLSLPLVFEKVARRIVNEFYFTQTINDLIANVIFILLFPGYNSASKEEWDRFYNEIKEPVILPTIWCLANTFDGIQVYGRLIRSYRAIVLSYLERPSMFGCVGVAAFHYLDVASIKGLDEDYKQKIISELELDLTDKEVRMAALKGLEAVCQWPIDQLGVECEYQILDWYLKTLGLISCEKTEKAALRKLYQAFQSGRKELMVYFERNEEIFSDLFRRYPEYNCIQCGFFERSKLEDIFKEYGVPLTYQAYDIFSLPSPMMKVYNPKNSRRGETRIVNRIPDESYKVLILSALARLSIDLARNCSECSFVNIQPNSFSNGDFAAARTTRKRKYVAIQWRFRDEYWILVDSVKPENAIYLWHGKDLEKGISIILQNKTYTLSREDVRRRYHRVNTKDTYLIYRQLILDAGGGDVL